MKNLTHRIAAGLTTAVLGAFVAAALSAPTVASAGLIDGSLNNLHLATHANVLGATVNADVSGGNANVKGAPEDRRASATSRPGYEVDVQVVTLTAQFHLVLPTVELPEGD
ncbi:hypothetical protein E1263_24780 [Kribbella antibiotica]|uniref:Secreted protein n=1 Tax=Kribbella antibiotica TaxID=190195 RepID=A0A4R4ZG94_9ACTN|nr:hypothetical protein [Kribbella antibiotica]TDD57066.1 hypothetical protein E1263_24780 [Kribbella antibiotica]